MVAFISMLLMIFLMFPYLFNLFCIFIGINKGRTLTSHLALKVVNLLIFIVVLILGMLLSIALIYILKLEETLTLKSYFIIALCYSYNIAYIFYEFYLFIHNLFNMFSKYLENRSVDEDDDDNEDDKE